MRTGRRQLAASPVLIGAVTLLVAIVAVFISYSANQGLPFVPTYQLKVELPNGAKLVPGNEVRAGGFRVGIVEEITSVRKRVDGEVRSIAQLDLKLDSQIEPLSKDTEIGVRPRSALGLKYVELVPGRAEETFADGATVPLENAGEITPELEDVLATFPPETRSDSQAALEGFGDAFAGRGEDINIVIRELNPFLRHLTPVMENLSDPATELRNFFPALGAAAAEAAPVAEVQARLFGQMADTFAAMSRDPEALRQTIEESPPTLAVATASFRVQTPFLARFADVSRELEPGAEELRRALPLVNDALQAGVPAFRRTPALSGDLEELFVALEDLSENPNTLMALRDLRRAVRGTRPAVEFIAPYQTVCNYFVYFFNPLGTHQSSPVPGGTAERILAKLAGGTQPNNLGTTESTRPVDVPADQDPQASTQQSLHTQYGGPAIDPSGRADCQGGQTGYPDRLITDGRYPPDNAAGGFQGGGSHVVVDPVIAVASYFGFTKANPFADPFELKAVVRDAQNLKSRAPVRIAGVDVGKVTKIEPAEDGRAAATVTMELSDDALPIHEDATLDIRSRILLEGNFFVDLKPGSPSAAHYESGDTIPITRTTASVTLPDILSVLKSDVRTDLQTLVREYGTEALSKGGAEALNQAIPSFEPAY